MKSDLPHVLLALGLLASVAWLPGIALCRLLAPGLPRLAVLAAAPAASAGVLYTTGQLADLAGAGVDGRLAGGVVLAAVGSLLWTEHGQWSRWTPRRVPVSVAGAWVLGAAIWSAGIRHLLAVPPHNDGFNHGFFVARIARLSTLDPAVVIPHDVITGGMGAAFYPLALHQQAAVLVRVADLDVAVAWTLTSLSLVVLALPIGMYVIGRHLFPENPRAVAACAWVAALTPGVSYSTTWWGGYPLAVGLALSPGVLACLIHLRTCQTRSRTAVLTGLALAGVAGVHTSELTLLAAIGGLLVVGPPLGRRAGRAALHATLQVTVPFALALLALAPTLAQMRQGLDERTFEPAADGLPFVKTVLEVLIQFSFVPPATPAALVIASLVGIGLALRRRTAHAWLACWALFGVLYVWVAAFPGELVYTLTSSWYSDRFRLGMILTFLAIPLVALALAGPLASSKGSRIKLWRAGSLALGGVLVVTSTIDSVSAIRENYDNYALVGPDEREAFAYLAQHVAPQAHVVNQHQDGSAWMYSLYGVAPVFAVKTFDYDRPEWREANYLAQHAHEAGRNTEVDRLLASFQARYVYVGPAVFPTERADLDRDALARSPHWRLVFERGMAQVYELVP